MTISDRNLFCRFHPWKSLSFRFFYCNFSIDDFRSYNRPTFFENEGIVRLKSSTFVSYILLGWRDLNSLSWFRALIFFLLFKSHFSDRVSFSLSDLISFPNLRFIFVKQFLFSVWVSITSLRARISSIRASLCCRRSKWCSWLPALSLEVEFASEPGVNCQKLMSDCVVESHRLGWGCCGNYFE